mgnify:CR=1 FL=1|tara:strand:- start:8244 stop:8501 length:258 start_codon:yes stop_codon:yes gene_type:complete
MTLHPYHRSGLYVARICALVTFYLVLASFLLTGEDADMRTLHTRIGAGLVWVASIAFWGRMSSGIRLLTVASCLTTGIVFLVVGL